MARKCGTKAGPIDIQLQMYAFNVSYEKMSRSRQTCSNNLIVMDEVEEISDT